MMTSFTDKVKQTDKRREVKRFIKFSIVGASGAVIDFGLFTLIIILTGWRTPVYITIANTISVAVAIVNNFVWNRLWTFPESRSRDRNTQLVQFVLVNIMGLFINSAIVYFTYTYFYIPTFEIMIPEHSLTLEFAAYIAKATAIGVVLFWNFGANRLWTYRGL
ncbi:MAG: hypothetical protein B6242_06565 [Anaerolineaceae bacterium 4572_78]|nr:MAG: hypothetical protein B6242_06565 [Anaerolineaceae bacterium 4572_78]